MEYYKDLREWIKALEESNNLVRIRREINKDTELMPLVRWQYRGLPENERKAFIFENIVDAKGKRYTMPVITACYAGTRKIYALGMMCSPDKIMETWSAAQANPIEPKLIGEGPVHEEIHVGDNLLEHEGLGEIPVPISTPGFDNGPYLTAPCWLSKDPETGVTNIGTYRTQIKSSTRVGIFCQQPQHMREHWQKCKDKGLKALQAAIILGPTPNIAYCSVAKIPFGTSEIAVAGGLAGQPVELVKCKTVDLEVPATAEIVIEGEIPTDYLEREGPFGEHTGYISGEFFNLYMNITCISHRKQPIYAGFISQFPPSESSVIRGVGADAITFNHLRYECNIPTVLDVHWHQESGSNQFCAIKIKKTNDAQPWQALLSASAYTPKNGKNIIVVDEDIDIHDVDALLWALCYRVQPDRDIKIVPGKLHITDPSVAPDIEGRSERVPGCSLLINATRKWPYPPTALPAKEFMEKAKAIWEEEKLPALTPKAPWYGYELGRWTQRNKSEAEMALRGDHYKIGEEATLKRKKV
ncbi:UbiD family decarboxylase [Thermodesulfobacteriota bacterium]